MKRSLSENQVLAVGKAFFFGSLRKSVDSREMLNESWNVSVESQALLPLYAGSTDGFTNEIRVPVSKPLASVLSSERKVGRSREGVWRPLPPSQVWAETGQRVCRRELWGGLGEKGPACMLPGAACLRPGEAGGRGALCGREGLRPSV